MSEIETAKYKVTGLVDIFDEQGQITGQYPIGSVQELTIARGTAAVEAGQAELFDEDAAEALGETGATGEGEVEETLDEDDENETGATGEEEVE